MSNYKTLGLPEGSSKEEVKKAYKRLVMVHHPDKGGNANTFILIKAAYEAIINNSGTTFYSDIRVLKGSYQPDGSFIFKFEVTNIRNVINGYDSSNIVIIPELGSYTFDIRIPKDVIKNSSYNVKILFIDFQGNMINKEYKLKQKDKPSSEKDEPKKSFFSKITNFFG